MHYRIFIFSSISLNFVLSVLHFKLKDDDVWAFLEETTVLDPRFKSKMDRDEIWDRVREAAVAANSEAATDEVFEFGSFFDCSTFRLWDISSLALWFLHGEILLMLSEQGETQRQQEDEEEEEDDYVN